MSDKVKLEVKNLKVSFTTPGGKVQAVRNIFFQLHEGETLAIVGESGSGKSVTARSMLGILANNGIVESGEILYGGLDLLKISEDQFQDIRGDKISMIFQDPLSSLNPIVKIGRQLTETMIIKGKARQKESGKAFKTKLESVRKLGNLMHPENTVAHNADCKKFNTFEDVHIRLKLKYDAAFEAAGNAVVEINNLLFKIEKNAIKNIVKECAEVHKYAVLSYDEFMVSGQNAETLEKNLNEIKRLARTESKSLDFSRITDLQVQNKQILQDAMDKKCPDFFALGYYRLYGCSDSQQKNNKISRVANVLPGHETEGRTIEQLNSILLDFYKKDFENEFLQNIKDIVEQSYKSTIEKKKAILSELTAAIDFFGGSYDNKTLQAKKKELLAKVEVCKEDLATSESIVLSVFEASLTSAVNNVIKAEKLNKIDVIRYNKAMAKKNAVEAKGKKLKYNIAPLVVIDIEAEKVNIQEIILRLRIQFEKDIENANSVDFNKKTEELIKFFRDTATGYATTVTKSGAKLKAIKLMAEVGIPDPLKRYNQYPFQFSGGMRQRIVIAIALSANPQILVCDEPTTALDVTIQAQILELINKLKRERNISVLFITHDLGVVANMADRIAVMYAGKIVEYGTVKEVFYEPAHPYTWALLSSMPDLATVEKLEPIQGTPPNMIYPPKGDAFALRNKYAMEIDFEEEPPMFKISDSHFAATWLLHEDAPKVTPPLIVTERIKRMKTRSATIISDIENPTKSTKKVGQNDGK